MLPLLSQNKIDGMEIATGKAQWGDLEDGSQGYVFVDNSDFDLRVNPQTLIELGVTEDDMMDCVDQIEETWITHEALKMSFGMYPDQGYKNVGLVFKSRSNPSVKCFFSPSDAASGNWAGYFSWYYSKDVAADSLGELILKFDRMSGDRTLNITASPIVPAYEDASLFMRGLKTVKNEIKEAFLQKIWHYHKNTKPGFKARRKEEILSEMKEFEKISTVPTGA